MSTTIEDRVILLLKDAAGAQDANTNEQGVVEKLVSFFDRKAPPGGHGFWERLAEHTGIASKRWRKVYGREQRVTSDMLEALARLFPQNAFWLATGITDAVNGHVAPMTAQTFPERLYDEGNAANRYFKSSIDLNKKLYVEGNVNLDDDKERLYATERNRPLANWHDSTLADAAYKISNSEEYAELKQLWHAKELEREERKKYILRPDERPWVQKRKERVASGVRATPILGVDARSQHQDRWDIFFEPPQHEPQKFALTVLNVPPRMLNNAEIEKIAGMDLYAIEAYLQYHGIAVADVIESRPGTIRNPATGLTVEEREMLKKIAKVSN